MIEVTTIGGLSQDEVMALIEVHSQKVETGSWPKRMHAERGQPNQMRALQRLIDEEILDNPLWDPSRKGSKISEEEDDTLRITPKGRNVLHAVYEVLTNSI